MYSLSLKTTEKLTPKIRAVKALLSNLLFLVSAVMGPGDKWISFGIRLLIQDMKQKKLRLIPSNTILSFQNIFL